MAQGYFIVHLEDNLERTEVIAELRYFAYSENEIKQINL